MSRLAQRLASHMTCFVQHPRVAGARVAAALAKRPFIPEQVIEATGHFSTRGAGGGGSAVARGARWLRGCGWLNSNFVSATRLRLVAFGLSQRPGVCRTSRLSALRDFHADDHIAFSSYVRERTLQ